MSCGCRSVQRRHEKWFKRSFNLSMLWKFYFFCLSIHLSFVLLTYLCCGNSVSSVCPSICHTHLLCRKDWSYQQTFSSSIILVAPNQVFNVSGRSLLLLMLPDIYLANWREVIGWASACAFHTLQWICFSINMRFSFVTLNGCCCCCRVQMLVEIRGFSSESNDSSHIRSFFAIRCTAVQCDVGT